MATVKVTSRLLDDIDHSVRSMRDRAEANLRGSNTDVPPDHLKAVMRAAEKSEWGEHFKLRDLLPENWCVDPSYVVFQFKSADGLVVHSTPSTQNPGVLLPPGRPSYSYTISIAYAHVPEELKQWVDEVLRVEQEITESRAKFDTIRSQIKAFLKQYASLNSALKDMPELEMYLPDEVKERLARKVTRGRKPTSESGESNVVVDRSALIGLAVADRVAGS